MSASIYGSYISDKPQARFSGSSRMGSSSWNSDRGLMCSTTNEGSSCEFLLGYSTILASGVRPVHNEPACGEGYGHNRTVLRNVGGRLRLGTFVESSPVVSYVCLLPLPYQGAQFVCFGFG